MRKWHVPWLGGDIARTNPTLTCRSVYPTEPRSGALIESFDSLQTRFKITRCVTTILYCVLAVHCDERALNQIES